MTLTTVESYNLIDNEDVIASVLSQQWSFFGADIVPPPAPLIPNRNVAAERRLFLGENQDEDDTSSSLVDEVPSFRRYTMRALDDDDDCSSLTSWGEFSSLSFHVDV